MRIASLCSSAAHIEYCVDRRGKLFEPCCTLSTTEASTLLLLLEEMGQGCYEAQLQGMALVVNKHTDKIPRSVLKLWCWEQLCLHLCL